MKKNLLNSDKSHFDLDHQSDCLFSLFDKVSTAIRNNEEHAQRAIKMSPILSHSATFKQLYSCILIFFKEETLVKVLFCLLPVGMCIDAYMTICSYVWCVSTH